MKVSPLNRLQYFRNLGVEINLFGQIFISVEILEIYWKRKRKKGHCSCWAGAATGQRPSQRGGPAQPTRARQVFKPDGRGLASVREGAGEEEDREADKRGPSSGSSSTLVRRRRGLPVMMQGMASLAKGTDGLSVASPFGWRWNRSPRWPGSPATR